MLESGGIGPDLDVFTGNLIVLGPCVGWTRPSLAQAAQSPSSDSFVGVLLYVLWARVRNMLMQAWSAVLGGINAGSQHQLQDKTYD